MKLQRMQEMSQAASEYAKHELGGDTVYLQPLMDAFESGAQWWMHTLWHEWWQTPEAGRTCLAVMGDDILIVKPQIHHGQVIWSPLPALIRVTQWAYVDDLLVHKIEQ